MSERKETQALLRLLTWMSPAFPVGAFAYSGGLERAVADDLVRDAATLRQWIKASLEHGTGWNDAVLLAEAHRGFEDCATLADLADLAAALSSSRERHAETLALGSAFLQAARAWPHDVLERLGSAVAYPVAIGAVSAAHGISLEPALIGYLHASASQSVSAAIRLSVIGQREGVEILAALEEPIERLAPLAASAGLAGLGTATVMADIETMRHETQHTRLFRS